MQLTSDPTEAPLAGGANTGTNLLTNRLKVLSSTSSLAEVANEDVINPAKTETILVIQPDNDQGECLTLSYSKPLSPAGSPVDFVPIGNPPGACV
jgi:hypothetical protein